MEKDMLQEKPKNKNAKKIILTVLVAILLICTAAGGFFAFKYVFPSDKDLFLLAHANLINPEREEVSAFAENTEISLELSGGFNSKKAVDTAESISITTKNTFLSEQQSSYSFSMNFLNNEFLRFSKIKDNETEFLKVPQLIEKTYAANSTNEILSTLFGSETASDIDIFDGVDKEMLSEYLKKYGNKLYDNIPDNFFTSTKENDEKIIVFKDNLNRMLYDIVNEIKGDAELRDFLYEQISTVYGNCNAKFPYGGTLLTIPDKEDFHKDYDNTLNEFIESIENAEIVITSHIKNRKILSETIKITESGEALYDISYDSEKVDFIKYKDSLENIRYSKFVEKKGTVTKKHTVLTIDINEWTKEQSDEQKNVSIIIDSLKDENVTEQIIIPEKVIDIQSLTEEEKTELQETVSENITNLLTSLTLSLLFL